MRVSHKVGVASLLLLVFTTTGRSDELSPEAVDFFESKIRPVLIRECYGCHSSQAGNVRGGLRLDNQVLTRAGGSSGPAVVPGDLEASLLFNAINHEDFVMPPKRKLPADVIEDFRKWIEMGAPDPRVAPVVEIRSSISADDIEEAKSSFWAYQPPRLRQPPEVQDESWPANDVDRFVLRKLEDAGLAPSDDAEAFQVVRRLCFDLVGLPPTPEQLTAFEKRWTGDRAAAVSELVDELLQQDQFGERWGRHWLDVARYAESTGREVNMTFPHAWRYRDYVIDSLNQDKPFDRFVQEQLAGDLLPASSDEEWTENLIATTFLAVGTKNVNEQNRLQFQADLIDEQIDATTRVFMGMSVACARCHDHKFDAIPQTDYYALAGIFQNTITYFGNPPSEFGNFQAGQVRRPSSLLRLPIDDPNPFDKSYGPRELEDLRSQLQDKLREAAEGRRQIAASSGNAQAALRNRLRLTNELAQLSAKLAVVDEQGKPLSYCMGVQQQTGTPSNARVLVRGEIDQPGQEIERGFPQVLCLTSERIDPDSSGRLELAQWIGSQQNPLTARVMVNRIWHHLIGQGIVPSTENFGVTGQSPSHPELLDYLAVRFVDSGWSVKRVIREIANSRIYRTASDFNEVAHQQDPDNSLLWRANPRRLDAEAIRDAMLSISGEIDLARPRGSEVARAGYQRVVGGFLGDPREAGRRAMESAGQEMREAMRSRFSSGGAPANQGFQRPGAGPRFAGSRFAGPGFRNSGPAGQGMFGRGEDARKAFEAAMQEAMRKVSSQLDMEDAKYRSVYLPVVRDHEPRSLDVFDFADSSSVTGTRESSNTANQALFMLNNPFVIQQSEALAKRLLNRDVDGAGQIETAFVLAYGRRPTSQEQSASLAFLDRFASSGKATAEIEKLTAFCQSLFASAEFRYLD